MQSVCRYVYKRAIQIFRRPISLEVVTTESYSMSQNTNHLASDLLHYYSRITSIKPLDVHSTPLSWIDHFVYILGSFSLNELFSIKSGFHLSLPFDQYCYGNSLVWMLSYFNWRFCVIPAASRSSLNKYFPLF